MQSLNNQLSTIVSKAFSQCGFAPEFGAVRKSDRPDLSQFQCNGALAAAKVYKKAPRQIAQDVVGQLNAHSEIFQEISLAGPGFINVTVKDEFLTKHVHHMLSGSRLGCEPAPSPLQIMIDYGGANIAKPLHIGHIRAAILGESLKRLARFLGHKVLGDVHLGDWGLQMGMLVSELERLQPDLPYFDENYTGPYPEESPVTLSDLEQMYPRANQRAKDDAAAMEKAREATYELQQGRSGYRALWRHFVDVSVADLKKNYGQLNVTFDLWRGESDTQVVIDQLIDRLLHEKHAYESEGAIVVDVAEADDDYSIPPLLLRKSDGAILYSTTDIATISQRVEEFQPNVILYVVDKRQSDHFRQVFRCSYKTGLASEDLGLEHIGFGTMNGSDGKPFKTRDGGTMRLHDLIMMVRDKARERIDEAGIGERYSTDEKEEIAKLVGIAALKFADLMNHYATDYVFDLERFSSFDGRTGPYLLYTVVRIKSILRKAGVEAQEPEELLPPQSDFERDILLKIAELPSMLELAFAQRAPNLLCEYAYSMAALYNRFYHEHHILSAKNPARKHSWLTLSTLNMKVLIQILDILGIDIPEKM